MLDLLVKGGTVVDGSGAKPETADVGIADGRIVEVGRVDTPARRTIAADGLTVTPGWIDPHTHYDGQATWDPELDPSFSSGVTTVIMGNCGVGFAPVARGTEERLVELMEGVEEIPGTALHEGLKWNWGGFESYLEVLDSMSRTMDVGALIPHGPLRLWAMGDKVGSNKCASDKELAAMTAEVDAAMRAGAFGLATSRTSLHRSSTGEMTPDYRVDEPELEALARVVARHGGYLEVAPDGLIGEGYDALRSEMALFDDIVTRTGVNLHVLMFQADAYPEYFAEQLAHLQRLDGLHSRVTAQIGGRSSGAMMSFLGTHPFMDKPFMGTLRGLPADQLLAALADPEVKARLIAEDSRPGTFGELLNTLWHRSYDLGAGYDFEPAAAASIETLARAAGRTPADLAYDLILETSRAPRLFVATTNYAGGELSAVRDALLNASVILGASDAGAHVTTICDGSMNSFMLTHWTRDRTRGPKMPLEQAVNLMTQKTAAAIGLTDRGVIAPGMKADLNVLDPEALKVHAPAFFEDLPAGARRLMQPITGYRATIVSGVPTREFDTATGERPGRLVRFGRTA